MDIILQGESTTAVDSIINIVTILITIVGAVLAAWFGAKTAVDRHFYRLEKRDETLRINQLEIERTNIIKEIEINNIIIREVVKSLSQRRNDFVSTDHDEHYVFDILKIIAFNKCRHDITELFPDEEEYVVIFAIYNYLTILNRRMDTFNVDFQQSKLKDLTYSPITRHRLNIVQMIAGNCFHVEFLITWFKKRDTPHELIMNNSGIYQSKRLIETGLNFP